SPCRGHVVPPCVDCHPPPTAARNKSRRRRHMPCDTRPARRLLAGAGVVRAARDRPRRPEGGSDVTTGLDDTRSTALVTGASRGFGRAIASALHAAGAEVVAVGRDHEALTSLRHELGGRLAAEVA